MSGVLDARPTASRAQVDHRPLRGSDGGNSARIFLAKRTVWFADQRFRIAGAGGCWLRSHRHGGPDARGTRVLRGRFEPATRRWQELEVWRACADATCVLTAIDLLQSIRSVTHGGVLLELFASP